MQVDGPFRVSSILLAAAGFIGLTIASTVPLVLILAGLCAILLTLAHAAGWRVGRLATPFLHVSTPVWNVLMVVAFLVCTADLIWLSQDLLLAGTNFLIVLMVNKLFNLHQRKDFLYLYAISFLMLLATASLTSDAWYALIFIAYLLAAIWTLLLYHLKNEAEEHQAAHQGPGGAAPIPISARFFWSTNAIAFMALVLTLAIFFVTPRTGTGFFQKGPGQQIRTSGFSQQVDLGVIGSIKLDPTVVMRVEFPELTGPVEGRVYLQGALYDHYTGRSWVNTLSRRRAVGEIYEGSFLVSRQLRPQEGRPLVRQDILIEALDAPVLFGMPMVQRVRGTFPLLQVDEIGGLHLPYPPSSRFQYTVFSVPNRLPPGLKESAALDYTPRIERHYLQVPRLSPDILALAREVTRNAATPYEKAVAIKYHLLTNYKYSLDVGTRASSSPMEDFFFRRKSGYCEHYATAMVLMLRAVGVPSRLVTGFLAGEWNDFGHYYTVRQQDAHAWVEVYFPGAGWITFDPTPSLVASAGSSPLEVAARLFDSFRVKWTRFVIQYSFRDQRAVLHEIRERSQPMRSRAAEWLTTATKFVKNWRAWAMEKLKGWDARYLAGALVAALLAWIVMVLRVRRRRARLPKGYSRYTSDQLAATRLYERMLDLLEQGGLPKAPTLAPLEYVRFVGTRWEEAGGLVQSLTDLYCRGRFSTSPLTTDDLSTANGLLDRLNVLLRQAQQDGRSTAGAASS